MNKSLLAAAVLAVPFSLLAAQPAHADDALNGQLLTAIQQDNLPLVKSLIQKGADANAFATLTNCVMQDGTQVACSVRTSPLLVATSLPSTEIAQYLINLGADPTLGIPRGFGEIDTPISIAYYYQFNDPGNPQASAADLQRTKSFESLYIPAGTKAVIAQKNVDELFDDNSESLLALAAEFGDQDSARALIAAGADVNLKAVIADDQGESPLLEAAFGNQPEMIRLLLKAGADVNLGRNGGTALEMSCTHGDPASAEALLDGGANPNLFDSDGNSPLASDVLQDTVLTGEVLANRIQVIHELVAHHVNINAQDPHSGNTALMSSIWAPNPDIVEALLDAGANPNLINSSNQTAMQIAEIYINNTAEGATPQQIPLYQKIVAELKAHGATH